MAPRLDLQQIFETLLGTRNVYFQPPQNIRMNYPCIVYKRATTNTSFANNEPYNHIKQYQVTVIDSNPDSLIPSKVATLPRCAHNTFFIVDHLNHDVYTLFF